VVALVVVVVGSAVVVVLVEDTVVAVDLVVVVDMEALAMMPMAQATHRTPSLTLLPLMERRAQSSLSAT